MQCLSQCPVGMGASTATARPAPACAPCRYITCEQAALSAAARREGREEVYVELERERAAGAVLRANYTALQRGEAFLRVRRSLGVVLCVVCCHAMVSGCPGIRTRVVLLRLGERVSCHGMGRVLWRRRWEAVLCDDEPQCELDSRFAGGRRYALTWSRSPRQRSPLPVLPTVYCANRACWDSGPLALPCLRVRWWRVGAG